MFTHSLINFVAFPLFFIYSFWYHFLLFGELPLAILLEQFFWQQIFLVLFHVTRSLFRLFYKDIFTGYRILCWQFFPLSTLKRYVILASLVSDEKYSHLNHCSSDVLFPLNAFKIHSLIFDDFGHRLFLFLSCLEFAIFLESVGLCISQNLGRFQSIFLQIYIHIYLHIFTYT